MEVNTTKRHDNMLTDDELVRCENLPWKCDGQQQLNNETLNIKRLLGQPASVCKQSNIIYLNCLKVVTFL